MPKFTKLAKDGTRRGGRRAGAGHPRSGKFTRSFFITDLECKALDKYLWINLRKKEAAPLRSK